MLGRLARTVESVARSSRSRPLGGGSAFWGPHRPRTTTTRIRATRSSTAKAAPLSAATTSSSSNQDCHQIDKELFYGRPRPADEESGEDDVGNFFGSNSGDGTDIDDTAAGGRLLLGTAVGRARLLLKYSAIALRDPTRADAVAAVGELTGPVALRALLAHMRADPAGQRILRERPLVSKDTIPYEALIAGAADPPSRFSRSGSTLTFGQAYGTYLATHGFDPDGRDPVRFVDDPELAYVMLRYRQCHDYWHALTGLPPTVAGELGLKWLELFQTGLPLPALSSAFASFVQLGPRQRREVWGVYLPWAYHTSKRITFGTLLSVYYEEEFDTPLDELRTRLKIVPAPAAVEVDWMANRVE